MSDRRRWLLVGLGALGLVASYPPFPLPFLSFVALIPGILLLEAAAGDPRRAYTWGFRFGLATNGLVLYWIVVALWHFTPLAALGYAVTVFLLGVFTGGLFWLVTRVRAAHPAIPLAVVFAVCWTGLEWGIGHLGDVAFPWLGLGTSLADARVLVQWADLAGARGITWWLVWCNVMLAGAVGRWGQWRAVWRQVLPVAATIVLATVYGVWRERTLPLRPVGTITLIQPNISFHEKWNPARADSEVAALLDLSREARAAARADLVIWPEAALPDYLTQRPDWQAAIGHLALETRTPILTGGIHVEFYGGGVYETYNAAFLFDSLGIWRSHPVYEKHYLVPVVERVPFVPVKWFRALPGLGRWSGGFGRGRDLPLFDTPMGHFGVIVCYESVFEDLARRYREAGAEFLVNVTNDAWYGRTSAPYQHASHLVLRAFETRMGIARSANDGISEFVDPLGRTSHESQLETRTTVTGTLLTSDLRPLYVRLGDWVGTLSILATIGFAGAVALHTRRRRA